MRRRTIGIVVTAGILGSLFCVPATVQAQPVATGPSYGSVNSAVVPQPDGAPSIFVEGTDRVVVNSWYTNGNWPWYSMAAYTTAPPATSTTLGFATSRAEAVLQPDGSPSIFFQGVGGSLWNYWYVNGTWDSAEIASGGVASTPAAILQPNGSPSVFVEGPNNSLLNYWYMPASGTWGEGTVAGPGSAFQAPAAVTSAGGPEVFVEGPDHSLYWYDYIPVLPGWFGQPVATPEGGALAFSAPSVVLQTDGTASIFVVGLHNSLVNYWSPPAKVPSCTGGCTTSGTCWSQGVGGLCWDSATVAPQGSAYSSPAVILQDNDAPSAFVLGPSGSLLNYWYIPSEPGWGAGTVEPSGSSQVFGVLVQTDGAPQVFSANLDGSLWYSSYAQGNWTNVEWGVSDARAETYSDPQ